MGFVDYVAEYFRGPAGPAGEPGPAGDPASNNTYMKTVIVDGMQSVGSTNVTYGYIDADNPDDVLLHTGILVTDPTSSNNIGVGFLNTIRGSVPSGRQAHNSAEIILSDNTGSGSGLVYISHVVYAVFVKQPAA